MGNQYTPDSWNSSCLSHTWYVKGLPLVVGPVLGSLYQSAVCGCGQLMWLKFEDARGPAGAVCGRFPAGLGPKASQTGPDSVPNDPDRTSDNLKLQPREL